MQIDIRHNIDVVVKQFKTNRTDQIPFATALALTRSVQIARDKLSERTGQVFDRPTPYTRNAFYVRPATKRNLVSSVGIKDEAYKGTPADRYLRPQIEGIDRNLKRSERALQAKGLMPTNRFAVPAAGAEIDEFAKRRRELRHRTGQAVVGKLGGDDTVGACRMSRDADGQIVGFAPGAGEHHLTEIGRECRG